MSLARACRANMLRHFETKLVWSRYFEPAHLLLGFGMMPRPMFVIRKVVIQTLMQHNFMATAKLLLPFSVGPGQALMPLVSEAATGSTYMLSQLAFGLFCSMALLSQLA